MKLEYNLGCAHLFDDNDINVEQYINPYINEPIKSKEDALLWAKQYLAYSHDSMILYFNLECKNNNEMTFYTDIEYDFVVSETTGALNGEYDLKIKNGDIVKSRTIKFTQGEALIPLTFKSNGHYELVLDNEFIIDEQKYLALIDVSESDLEVASIDNLSLELDVIELNK